MNLKIKTKDIEIEYTDEYAIIEESAKKRVLEILDTVFNKQMQLDSIKPIPNPNPVSTYHGTAEHFFNTPE